MRYIVARSSIDMVPDLIKGFELHPVHDEGSVVTMPGTLPVPALVPEILLTLALTVPVR